MTRDTRPFNGDEWGMSWTNYLNRGGLAATLLRGWAGDYEAYHNAVASDTARMERPRFDGSTIPSIFEEG